MSAHRLRLKALRRLALCIATFGLVGPVHAQIFAGVEPLPAVSVAQPAAAVLRPMPSVAGSLMLTGENGSLRWPVYITKAQSKADVRIRVGFLSAVSIMPDMSTLTVSVNDRRIGVHAIDASQGVRTAEFAVPSGMLAAGMNAIAVTVKQRHRVDCSVAATYELWTRIDPRSTGLVLPAAATGVDSLDDTAALSPEPDGSMPIHIVLNGKTNPRHLERLIRATQLIALAGHFMQPSVDFATMPGDANGVDLVVGTRAALEKVSRVADRLGGTGPLATLIPANEGQRPLVLITGSDDSEVDKALDALASYRGAAGTAAGRLTELNADGHAASGGESLKLGDLDVKSQQFNGRFFHQGFDLALPADMLASDYGRGSFDLAGAYAAGLAQGAEIRVDVNGQSAGLIKLPDIDGDVFKHNQLFLPLRMMRPGLNHFDVYAETPRPADTSCAASDARRFLFLDTSVLQLPSLARVLRVPDLASTVSGGLPFAAGRAHLVIPKPDRDTVAAALSLTARAAVAAGKPVAFSFSTTVTDDPGSTLIVSPARALDPDMMRRTGLDPASIEKAWENLTPMRAVTTPAAPGLAPRWWLASAESPLACRLPMRMVDKTLPEPSLSPAVRATADATSTDDDEDLLVSWTGQTQGPSWQDRLSAASTRAMDWVGSVESALLKKQPATHQMIGPNSSLVLAQGFSAHYGSDVTTIVTAPDAVTLRRAVGCLLDRAVWPTVHGRLAELDASSGHVTTIDATRFRYAASGSLSLRNMRLVAAGWLSLNPIAFVIIALMLAAILSGTTPLFVRRIGRKSE